MEFPTLFSDSKWEQLIYILHKVKKKTCRWLDRYLSFASKEILPNYVASALQNFDMQCFILPEAFNKDID